ncbi:HAD family hydrolase [Bradymonas sediminis]|uniref:HAD-IB family hydrolase n=1 Tax=Bradymonas sediminis TaxID=1548548 RepID=A0A2Z4FIR7_9DELT|nr:HAD family hydrolase [Bradymonas sediminis]AWV88842.1 HAD-IB family hydrolase [Bradymonas sediminis]TDP71844.1 HAD superfamily hydrolase (TIGR01490 family) [Bradymonas sediminis]
MSAAAEESHKHKKPKRPTAAFYDVDGTLISTNVVHAYAYYAMNSPMMSKKLSKTAGLLASLPAYWLADKFDRRLFNVHFYKNYAGFSEDRLVVLGEEIFENVIRPNIFEGARSLVAKSKEQGHRQVLITGAIDVITAPLADFLGVDDFVANRLEMKDGIATGRLLKPVLAGASKALWVRQYGEKHGLDLDGSFAYADSGSDIPLLSVVGHPCAVNPDFRMRTNARAYDWPILNLK